MRIRDVIQRGTRSSQPAAASTDVGVLYCVTDEGDIVERNSGSAWESYSPPSGSAVGIAPNGRLTTESGVPVSTSDRTAQGTIYFTPYNGASVYLYNGTDWDRYTLTERSLALTATSGKNYDVFLYSNSGTLTLELSSAWTNDTTRADALALQNGLYVKSGATTRLWLGTIRASGANVTEDSGGGTTTQVGGKRFVWNAYNQVQRWLRVIDTADSWAYTTDTWRVANGATAPLNCVEWVTGDAAMQTVVDVRATVNVSAGGANTAKSGIGLGNTTPVGLRTAGYDGTANSYFPISARYTGTVGLGYRDARWLEKGAAANCTFIGDQGGNGTQSGMEAVITN